MSDPFSLTDVRQSPGRSKVFGTDANGNKGWQDNSEVTADVASSVTDLTSRVTDLEDNEDVANAALASCCTTILSNEELNVSDDDRETMQTFLEEQGVEV